MKKSQTIFDPRRLRAESKGPHSQAEAVTGTHLYAYFQDQNLPTRIIRQHSTNNSSSSSSSSSNNSTDVNKTNNNNNKSEEATTTTAAAAVTIRILDSLIYHTSSDRSKNNNNTNTNHTQCAITGSETGDNAVENNRDETSFSKKSLLQQIKSTREIFLRALYSISICDGDDSSSSTTGSSSQSIVSTLRNTATTTTNNNNFHLRCIANLLNKIPSHV